MTKGYEIDGNFVSTKQINYDNVFDNFLENSSDFFWKYIIIVIKFIYKKIKHKKIF